MGRELSDCFKQSFRSLPEVADALGSIFNRLRGRKVLWRGEKITREKIFNALILYLDGLSDAECDEVLRKGLRKLGSLLDSEVPGGSPNGGASGSPIDLDMQSPDTINDRLTAGHGPQPGKERRTD